MNALLAATDHRPWPLPARRWMLRQRWLDLGFIHYRVEAAEIQRRLPPGLKVQQFDGSAWIGVVPFRMQDVALRPLPAVPAMSTFPELNVRTYVEAEGKAGVWFFSLDARSRLVVTLGRRLFALPYHRARARQCYTGGVFDFESERCAGAVRFAGRYRGVGPVYFPTTGRFEHWMAERYCLYAEQSRERLIRVQVHHRPWPMQAGEFEPVYSNVLEAAGLAVLDPVPRVHFTSGVDVVSYGLERVGPSVSECAMASA